MVDRALALNPSFSYAWYWSGWLRLMAGDPELAIQHFETSLRLSPRDQQGFHLAGIGTGQFLQRRFAEAAATLRVSLEEMPSFTPTYRTLASCYAHMGRLEDAREMLRRLKLLTPAVIPTVRFFRKPEHIELYVSGLRLAAADETS
jgi:adenylate cyclase